MSNVVEYPLGVVASEAQADVRAAFIRRTYAHLAGAVLVFAAIEAALVNLPGIEQFILVAFSSSVSCLVVFLAFLGVSYLARMWANSDTSVGVQYAGLGLYVVALAVMFLPLIYVAHFFYPADRLIAKAGIMTLGVFGGLTGAVLVTRKDFSFLGPILAIASLLALGFFVAGFIFGFSTPLVVMCLMVALACGFTLYDTSNVLHHFRTDQHVAAALELFASVGLLFYWILRILMSSRD